MIGTQLKNNIVNSNEIIDITCSQIDEIVSPNDIVQTDKISYTELHNTASELCRVVSNDQRSSKLTYIKLKEWIQRLRNNEDFDIIFQNNVIGLENKAVGNQSMMPLSSTVSTTNSQKIGKRYKSFRERNLSILDKRNTNQDELHTKPRKKT